MIPLIKSTFYNETETKKKLTDFINSSSKLSFGKECLKFEHNFQFFDDYNFIESVSNNPKLNLEYIAINPNVVKSQRYPLLFESFKDIFSKDIKKLFEDDINYTYYKFVTPKLQNSLNMNDQDYYELSNFELESFANRIAIKLPYLENKFGDQKQFVNLVLSCLYSLYSGKNQAYL